MITHVRPVRILTGTLPNAARELQNAGIFYTEETDGLNYRYIVDFEDVPTVMSSPLAQQLLAIRDEPGNDEFFQIVLTERPPL